MNSMSTLQNVEEGTAASTRSGSSVNNANNIRLGKSIGTPDIPDDEEGSTFTPQFAQQRGVKPPVNTPLRHAPTTAPPSISVISTQGHDPLSASSYNGNDGATLPEESPIDDTPPDTQRKTGCGAIAIPRWALGAILVVILLMFGVMIWAVASRGGGGSSEVDPSIEPPPSEISTPQPTPLTPQTTPAPNTPTTQEFDSAAPVATTAPPTEAPIDPTPSPTPSPTPPTADRTIFPTGTGGAITTAMKTLNEGVLKCGVSEERMGFSILTFETGQIEGFEADLCRAIAAAVLGTPDAPVDFVSVTSTNRFQALQNGDVDVLASHTTKTMERDVYESTSGTGFSFSTPYLYEGVGFGGRPPFVDCADNRNTTFAEECATQGLRICVTDGTTHVDVVNAALPDATVSALPSLSSVYQTFTDGFCDVIAGEQFEVAEATVRANGYTQEYAVGELGATLSSEPLSLVTRQDDPVWSDMIEWVLQALLSAEERGITAQQATAMPLTTLFGEEFRFFFVNALSAVGNYGQMYSRHLESIVPRSEVNKINTDGTSGLHFVLPFGDLSVMGVGPIADGTLERIIDRGHLRCGITRSVGFGEFDPISQEWVGLDVDYCRAVSAAIFNGVYSTVVYTVLPATERFVALASGDVDLLSRITTWTFSRDVKEPTSQTGFSFSQPDFYDGLAVGGIPPYAACADSIDTSSSTCQDLKICVNDGTTTIARFRELFAERFLVPTATGETAIAGLATGACNVVAGSVLAVAELSIRNQGYSGPYEVGAKRFSKEPLALVTRQDDSQFTAFVNWILIASFYAEAQGITQATGNQMPQVSLFGPLYGRMLIDAVQAVGNYGEIYERNVEELIPRAGLNLLNTEPFGPQHYSQPGI